jgi:hypothetical protein
VPEPLKLYLDQMFRLEVAQALCDEGYDIVRASDFGDWVILPLKQHSGVIRLKADQQHLKIF